MSMELNPQTERLLMAKAAREGVSVDELIVRHFALATPRNGAYPAPDADADKERVFDKLRRMQEEYGLPLPSGGYKSLSELSAQWAAEDAGLSGEERQADRDFWEGFSRRERQPIEI